MLLVRIGHLDSGSIKDQKIPKDMIHLLIKIGSVAIAVFLCTYCLKIATRKAMLYHNTARYLGRKRGHLLPRVLMISIRTRRRQEGSADNTPQGQRERIDIQDLANRREVRHVPQLEARGVCEN